MKLIDVLEILGAVFGVGGALLLSTGHFAVLTTFILYFISSSCWVWAGILRKNRPLLLMNLVFLLININGLYTHFKV